MSDDFKIPTPKQIHDILKRLTPEERRILDGEMANTMAKIRRSQFKLISGGRRQRS